MEEHVGSILCTLKHVKKNYANPFVGKQRDYAKRVYMMYTRAGPDISGTRGETKNWGL